MDSILQNFLESIAYIIPRITVSCQTPEDVVNKTTKHVELIESEMKIYEENVSTTNELLFYLINMTDSQSQFSITK